MRVIIFSDSLARPRPESKQSTTEYEDTYGYKLKKHFLNHEIEIIYIDSLDTIDAVYWNERMVAFRRPDLVFYHLGVNDCAPRIFKKNSRSILLKPWFRKVTFNFFMKAISILRRHLVRSLCRNKVYVKKSLFQKNLVKMMADVKLYSHECEFHFISIASQPNWLERKSPGFNRNSLEYNEIIKKIAGKNFHDVDNYFSCEPEDYLIYDGIHFTKESHNKLFDRLVCVLGKASV